MAEQSSAVAATLVTSAERLAELVERLTIDG